MTASALVVVGASAGGVAPLVELTAAWPGSLRAAVCVSVHVGRQPSILPELLRTRCALPVSHARDGELLLDGHVYVAPPDRHLLVDGLRLRLSSGPRVNHARPAIDPLFWTAARHWGRRAVGVLLSGALDDGTAGLAAIKARGGLVVVQDPATAAQPSMPCSALAQVEVDHCLAPARIGPVVARAVARLAGPATGHSPCTGGAAGAARTSDC